MNTWPRFTVIVTDFLEDGAETVMRRDGLPLPKASRIAERQLRSGFKIFGGEISRSNWGGRGGDFPRNYRSATITLDTRHICGDRIAA